MKTVIKNGRVVDPANKIDQVMDILIENGKIAKADKQIKNINADQVLEAKGMIVTPGLVDLQVHFREPGREDRETIETCSRAALRGGITSALAMPNVTPVADNQNVIEFVVNRAKALDLINVYPVGSISMGQKGESLANIWEMQNSGAVAVTDDGMDVQNEGLLYKAMQYCKTHAMLLMSHCEIESLSRAGVMHAGWISTRLGLPGIPEIAEDLAVIKNIVLAEKTGARVHILHVSTKGAVEAIRQAKARGCKNITAETCPQYFSLTDEECLGYNTYAKMYPPLRTAEHVRAVVEGLQDGTIDVISTDHAPHNEPDKIVPFADAVSGTVGLETSFAVANTFLLQTQKLSLTEIITKMSYASAQISRINKGTLSIGADADIAIFDLNRKWKVDSQKFESKGRNCVFNGKEVLGKAVYTLVKGKVKMAQGKIM
jgi:dihydroorotase